MDDRHEPTESEEAFFARLEAQFDAEAAHKAMIRAYSDLLDRGLMQPAPSWRHFLGHFLVVASTCFLVMALADVGAVAVLAAMTAGVPAALLPFYWDDPRVVLRRVTLSVHVRHASPAD